MWKFTVSTLLAIIFGILAIANAFNVEIYEQKHFKGKHAQLHVKGCTNVPSDWDDTIESIDPSECIVIFKHPDCQGSRVRIEPSGYGSAHLEQINFEDKISSIAPCFFWVVCKCHAIADGTEQSLRFMYFKDLECHVC